MEFNEMADEFNNDDFKFLYTKEDIQLIFSCGRDKAENIMILLKDMGYGFQLGKKYYVRNEELKLFIRRSLGKHIYV